MPSETSENWGCEDDTSEDLRGTEDSCCCCSDLETSGGAGEDECLSRGGCGSTDPRPPSLRRRLPPAPDDDDDDGDDDDVGMDREDGGGRVGVAAELAATSVSRVPLVPFLCDFWVGIKGGFSGTCQKVGEVGVGGSCLWL